MSRRTHIIKNLTPSNATIFFYNVVALAVAYLGYETGNKFVRDHYFEGAPMTYLLGGDSGLVISYGLTMQAFVDLNRITCGRSLDERLRDSSVGQFMRRNTTQTAILYDPLNTEASPNKVTWNKSYCDLLKIVMLRLIHYGAAIYTGAAVNELAIYFMFDGEGIDASQTQMECTIFAAIGLLVEFGFYLSASRGDNYGGVVLEEIQAVEISDLPSSNGASIFGGVPKSDASDEDDLEYHQFHDLEAQDSRGQRTSYCALM